MGELAKFVVFAKFLFLPLKSTPNLFELETENAFNWVAKMILLVLQRWIAENCWSLLLSFTLQISRLASGIRMKRSCYSSDWSLQVLFLYNNIHSQQGPSILSAWGTIVWCFFQMQTEKAICGTRIFLEFSDHLRTSCRFLQFFSEKSQKNYKHSSIFHNFFQWYITWFR